MTNRENPSISSHYKLRKACRYQVEFKEIALDDTLAEDHRARKIWQFVEEVDTDNCLKLAKSVKGRVGRAGTCPKVLFALWLFAITDGVTSARKIADLCMVHDAYRWLAGGVSVSHTVLSQFRKLGPEAFDDLLTSSLAVMIKAGVIHQEDMAQDGTKVKASAGCNTFRTEKGLKELEKDVRKHIKELEETNHRDPGAYDARKLARKKKEAAALRDRIKDATKQLKENKKTKKANAKKRHKKPPSRKDLSKMRASHTDPDCRLFKMGDGGFRRAYNVQYASGVETKLIYGVMVTNLLDPGYLTPVMSQTHDRLEHLGVKPPACWLADAGYSGKSDIEAAAEGFPVCPVYAPAKTNSKIDATIPKKGDSQAVVDWRQRLTSPEMKDRYKDRCSTAEFVNAQTKMKGMTEFLVRGLRGVTCMGILHAIAHNVMTYFRLLEMKETAAM